MDVEVDINQNHDNFFSKQVVHSNTSSAFIPHRTSSESPTESPSVSKLKLFFDEVQDDAVFDDDIDENDDDDEGHDDEKSFSDGSKGGFVKRRIERWEQLSQGDETDVTGAVIQGQASLELRQRDPPAPVVIPPTFLHGPVSDLQREHHNSEAKNELSSIRFNVIRMKADFQMTELKLNHGKWQYDVNKGNKQPVRTQKRNPGVSWSSDNLSLPDIPENMAVRKRAEGAPNVAQQISLTSFGNDGRRKEALGHQHLINQAVLASSRGQRTHSAQGQPRLAAPPNRSQGLVATPPKVNQGTAVTQRRSANNHGLEAMERQLRNMNKPIEQKQPPPQRTLIAPLQPFGNNQHHSQRVSGSGGMGPHDYHRDHRQTFDRSGISNVHTSHAVQNPRTIPQRDMAAITNVDFAHSGMQLPDYQREQRHNNVRSETSNRQAYHVAPNPRIIPHVNMVQRTNKDLVHSNVHTSHAVQNPRTIPQRDMAARTNVDFAHSRIQSNDHQRVQQHRIARPGPTNLHGSHTLPNPRANVQDNMVTRTNEGLVHSKIPTHDYKSTVQHWFERSGSSNMQTSHSLPDTRTISHDRIVTRPNGKDDLKNERDKLLNALSDFLVEQDAVQQLEDEMEEGMSLGGHSEGFGYDSEDSMEMGSSDTNDIGTQFPFSNEESLPEEQSEFEADESKCLIEGTSQTFQSSEFTYDVCIQVNVRPTPEITTNGFSDLILAQVDSPQEAEPVDNSEQQEQTLTMAPLKEPGDTRQQNSTSEGKEDMMLPLNHPNDNEQFSDVSAHLGNILEELALEMDTRDTPINNEQEEALETLHERNETLINNKNNRPTSDVVVEEFIPSQKCSHDNAQLNTTDAHRDGALEELSNEMDSCSAPVSEAHNQRERTQETSPHLDGISTSSQSDATKVVVEECVPHLKSSRGTVPLSAHGAHYDEDLDKLALEMKNGNTPVNLETQEQTPKESSEASSKNSKVVVEEFVPRLKCLHDNAQFSTGSAPSGDMVEKLAQEMDNCNSPVDIEEREQVPEKLSEDVTSMNTQCDTSKVVVEEFVPRRKLSNDNVQFRSSGAHQDYLLEELSAEIGNEKVDLEERYSSVDETLPNSQGDTSKEVIAETVSNDKVQISAVAADYTDVLDMLADETDNHNIPVKIDNLPMEEDSPSQTSQLYVLGVITETDRREPENQSTGDEPTWFKQGPMDSHDDKINAVLEEDQLHPDISVSNVLSSSVDAPVDDGSERLALDKNTCNHGISTHISEGLDENVDIHANVQSPASEGEISEQLENDNQDAVTEMFLDQQSVHMQSDTHNNDIENVIHRHELPDNQARFKTNDALRDTALDELTKEMDKSRYNLLDPHKQKVCTTWSDRCSVYDDERLVSDNVSEVLAKDIKSSINLFHLSTLSDEGKFHNAFKTELAIDEDDPAVVEVDHTTSQKSHKDFICKENGEKGPVSPRRSKIPLPKSKLARRSSCPTRNSSNETVLNQNSKTAKDLRCEKDSSLEFEAIGDSTLNVTGITPSPTFSKSFSFRHERSRSSLRGDKQQRSHIPVPKSQFHRRGSCPVRSRHANKDSNGKSPTPISKDITNLTSNVPESDRHTGKKRSREIDITDALVVGGKESARTIDVDTSKEQSTCEIEPSITDASKSSIPRDGEFKPIAENDAQPLSKTPFNVDDFIQQAKQILSKIPVPPANAPETQNIPLHLTASVEGDSQDPKDQTGSTQGVHDEDNRAAPFPEKDMELLSLFLEVREDDTGSDTLTLHSENDSDVQTPTADDMSGADDQSSSKSRIPVLKESPRSDNSSQPERKDSEDEAVDLAGKERSVARISPMPRELEDELTLTPISRKPFRSKIPLPSPIAIKQPFSINRNRSYSETDGENTMVPEISVEEGRREEVEDTEDEVYTDQPSESEHECTGFPRRSQSSREVRPRGSYWAFSTSPSLASSEFERSQTLRSNQSKNYRRSPAVTPRITPGGTPRTTPRGTPRITPRSTQRNTPRSTPRDTPKGGSLRRQSPRAKTPPTFKSRECAFVPLPEWNRLREVLSSGEQSKQSTCPPSPSDYSYTSRRSSEEFQKVHSPTWGAPVTTPKPSRWRVDGRVPQHLKKKYSSMNDMGDPNDLYPSDMDDGSFGAAKEGAGSPWLKQLPIRASTSSQSVSLTDRRHGSQDRNAYLPGQRSPTNARVRSPYPVDTASDVQPMSSTENVSTIWTEDDTLESSNFSIPSDAKRKSWKRRFSLRRKKSADPSKAENKESDPAKKEKKKRKNWILRFLGIRK